jgi:hypothetical protein
MHAANRLPPAPLNHWFERQVADSAFTAAVVIPKFGGTRSCVSQTFLPPLPRSDGRAGARPSETSCICRRIGFEREVADSASAAAVVVSKFGGTGSCVSQTFLPPLPRSGGRAGARPSETSCICRRMVSNMTPSPRFAARNRWRAARQEEAKQGGTRLYKPAQGWKFFSEETGNLLLILMVRRKWALSRRSGGRVSHAPPTRQANCATALASPRTST